MKRVSPEIYGAPSAESQRGQGAAPRPIGEVLNNVLEEAGVLRQFERLGVLDLWPEIVGERVAEVTHARSVDDTTPSSRLARDRTVAGPARASAKSGYRMATPGCS